MPDASASTTAAPAAAVGVATVPGATAAPDVIAAATAALARPGLVVLAGAAGSGRTTTMRRIAAAFRGPVHTGGGLAMLTGVPALALSRALRVRLPVHDPALLAEAVRSRVRAGLLLLDDVQWADPQTITAIPAIAEHCRILVTLRSPHRIPEPAVRALRAAADAWLTIPPLAPAAAAALARQSAPGITDAAVAAVVHRAGGIPLAVTALARQATTAPATADPRQHTRDPDHIDALAHAVAAAVADLTRPARTALAALGLLGRPASLALLGDGVNELLDATLIEVHDAVAAPTSPYTAEVAAGLLTPAERQAMHRRLAEVVPPREAARHLAAAAATDEAYRTALTAAAHAAPGERAELLLFACDLPGVQPAPHVRRDAARAALAAGRPTAALNVLGDLPDPAAAVVRGEALLQRGAATAARAAVATVTDTAPPDLIAARDRVMLLAQLAVDPAAARHQLTAVHARHGQPPADPGVRAAAAAVAAASRDPGWERALASAASAASEAGDRLATHWSAWLLVETLAADARLAEASRAASAAAQACANDLAYSWQARFQAAALWCDVLRGADVDDATRRAGNLTDHAVPAAARGYATAAIGLAEADCGLLAAARARLAATSGCPPPTAAALEWVRREAAWLDGQPDLAVTPPPQPHGPVPIITGLNQITARWAALDTDPTAPSQPSPASTAGQHPDPPQPGELRPVRQTLDAWADPDQFPTAAAAWHELARREEVRCLLAAGLLTAESAAAVPALLSAEQLAADAGLVVLLGRVRRALRRHAVRRDHRGRRAGDDLTDREREILTLVARGEPTRRIAGQLGISKQTVETHVRSGMRKLGARTRTEAAAIVTESLR